MKKLRIILLLSLFFILYPNLTVLADPVQISGSLNLFYWRFEGTIDAVDVPLNGQLVNTGPITYFLDLTNPGNQIHTFNFDTMTEEYRVDLLVTSPLLESLGAPPQKITVAFSGPLTSVTPSMIEPGVFTVVAIQGGPLHGGGTFGPGQLFEGWTYSNIQINHKNTEIKVNGDGNVIETKPTQENNLEGQVTGQLTPPGGSPIPLTGSGTGLLNPEPIPEPTSILLLATGVAGIAAAVRKRRKT